MSYAFIQDVPADEKIYSQVRAKFGARPPKGLVSHLAVKRDGGLRYIDIWAAKEDWERFRDDTVEPAVSEVLASYGIPHDHSLVDFEELVVVDTWLGADSTQT